MSEYIISTEQINGITPYLLAEKKIPSWLACWALWDVSGAVPQRKDDGVAIGLPEIVRCMDCEHFTNSSHYGAYCMQFGAPLHDDYDGFCAWGERKNG